MEIVYENLQITDFERIHSSGFSLLKPEKKTASFEGIPESRPKPTAEFKFSREIEKSLKKSFEIRPISPLRAVY